MPTEFDDDDVESEEETRISDEEAIPDGSVGTNTFLPKPSVSSVQDFLRSSDTSESSVLQMEVREVLRETRVEYGNEPGVDRFISKLTKDIQGMPEQQVHGKDAAGFISALGQDPEEVSLKFKPPSKVTVIGSYALHTVARPEVVVDVAVEIPEDCLFKKAHLNYRYHSRRALYLSTIAKHLGSLSPLYSSCQITSMQDDPTRPTLTIHLPSMSEKSSNIDIANEVPSTSNEVPSTSGRNTSDSLPSTLGHKKRLKGVNNRKKDVETKVEPKPYKPSDYLSPSGFTVKVIPVISPSTFVVSKLSPEHNSVRWVTQLSSSLGSSKQKPKKNGPTVGVEEEKEESNVLPTPQYNTKVLQDMLYLPHAAYLSSALSSFPNLSDGILLLKTWARQRALLGKVDAFDGHTLTMLMVHLAKQGKMSPVMSPLQMLRVALHALSDTVSGLPKGLGMARDEHNSSAISAACSAHPPSVSVFRHHFDVVFVDFTGWLNLTAGMTKSALAQVVSAAKQTLQILQSSVDVEAAFAASLLFRSSPATMFDYHWRIRVPVADLEPGEHSSPKCGNRPYLRDVESKVEDLVKRALSDRATLVRVMAAKLLSGQGRSCLEAGLPVLEGEEGGNLHGSSSVHTLTVTVMANVDATLALRLADVGPAADDTKASAAFRAFWGAKSELRRFQDGKISEAVVWDCAPVDRHKIPDRIVQYAAGAHLPPGSSVACCSGHLDRVLTQRPPGSGSYGSEPCLDPNTGISAFRMMEAAVDKLGKQLRSVEGAALKVLGVQPISTAARQTCPYFPLPHPLAGGAAAAGALSGRLPRCLEPVEVLVQLEASGRWPDDPQAFSKTKAALGLQLAGLIETGFGYKTVASEDSVDVLMDGFAFRLLLYSTRDEAMLVKEQALMASSITRNVWEAPSLHPIPSMQLSNNPLVRSWHHGLVSSATGVNPSLAPAIRVAKRWVGTQMLSNHIAEEAVELLVVAAAASLSTSLPPPGSMLTGFMRFLELLSHHPWSTRPMVVDPEHQLSPQERRQISKTFDALRVDKHQKMPALFLCTSKDLESKHWTATNPTPDALQQLQARAFRTLRLLRPLIETGPHHSAAPHTTIAQQKRVREEDDEEERSLWMSAFCLPSDSGAMDVILHLRVDSLPQACRALPVARVGSLTSDQMGGAFIRLNDGKPGFNAPKSMKRSRLESAYQPVDLLTDIDRSPNPPPDKRARVFLRAFPEKLAEGRGPNQLVPELLVGFDPVPMLVEALKERFDHLAAFCADYHGGTHVGIKWKPAAFLPSFVQATTAHTALPCTLSLSAESKKISCVPNLVQVLSDMLEIGEGIIIDITCVA
ncbi:hypothetical protein CEUSTIGMA_g5816.t1 [Chlamydomonas eustigma]|uniref:Nucleolar protein 6 n=1 Tax=Chlamydomonas eustigma TaxID=1157962 RepID=A0A250X5K4_9CHLO|nr:hypothetical protein CEUSTIGMA_g5816.t1 [Chlamydomonas eustigma]|eukprot:GAX78374.1 hypothetical protein CEUSTIGMA_g5816.t1 [Chlamydomonas eustigma]